MNERNNNPYIKRVPFIEKDKESRVCFHYHTYSTFLQLQAKTDYLLAFISEIENFRWVNNHLPEDHKLIMEINIGCLPTLVIERDVTQYFEWCDEKDMKGNTISIKKIPPNEVLRCMLEMIQLKIVDNFLVEKGEHPRLAQSVLASLLECENVLARRYHDLLLFWYNNTKK